jgi:hypothetical protein
MPLKDLVKQPSLYFQNFSNLMVNYYKACWYGIEWILGKSISTLQVFFKCETKSVPYSSLRILILIEYYTAISLSRNEQHFHLCVTNAQNKLIYARPSALWFESKHIQRTQENEITPCGFPESTFLFLEDKIVTLKI